MGGHACVCMGVRVRVRAYMCVFLSLSLSLSLSHSLAWLRRDMAAGQERIFQTHHRKAPQTSLTGLEKQLEVG